MLASDVIAGTSQDVQALVGTGHPALLDYTNRIHLEVLRYSNWKWLQSSVQHFITQLEQTDYWVGATGSNPTGTVDTGLNLTDMKWVQEGSVYDRSNYRTLQKVTEKPFAAGASSRDDVWRQADQPRVWIQNPDNPNILSLYPAPDNKNIYTPEPPSPSVTITAGGSGAAYICYVTVTWVDSMGNESSAASPSTKIYVPANSVFIVAPPVMPLNTGATGIKYDRYNVYASTTQGSECLQSSNNSTASSWTLPNSGLVTGTASAPSANNVEPVDGYIIEFRYMKARPQVTTTGQTLLVPDDYKDVMIAGVNALAYQYLADKSNPDFGLKAASWNEVYQQGIRAMVRDKNLFPRRDFIAPILA